MSGATIEHLFLTAPGPAAGSSRRWADALTRELELREADGWRLARPLRSVHVGRGAVTAPDVAVLALEALGPGRAPSGEFAVETRARDVRPPVVDAWLEAGVTRVALAWAGVRTTTPAAELLRVAGVTAWSVDLSFGGSSHREAVLSLEPLLDLAPPQVSLVERTPSGDPDRVADEYLELCARLSGAGYEQWELTSFAHPGRVPVHHRAVWCGAPYLGLGPGAHSFDGDLRLWNLDAPDAYFSRIGRGADPAAGRERPDEDQRLLERIWCGLRLAEGLSLSELPEAAREIRSRWVARGWAHADSHRLRLDRRGWLLLDELAVELASAGTG